MGKVFKISEEEIDGLKVNSPPNDINKLSKKQAFILGQMNMLAKITELVNLRYNVDETKQERWSNKQQKDKLAKLEEAICYEIGLVYPLNKKGLNEFIDKLIPGIIKAIVNIC